MKKVRWVTARIPTTLPRHVLVGIVRVTKRPVLGRRDQRLICYLPGR